MKKLAFILSAPAGTGKTTLFHLLQKKIPQVEKSLSFTSRALRKDERHAHDYFFLSEEEFLEKEKRGDFLESVSLFGNHYGTEREQVLRRLQKGKIIFFIIDVVGARILRKQASKIGMQLSSIFLLPPSLEELKKRLDKRQSESPNSIQRRLQEAQKELDACQEYDYCIVNDDLQEALEKLKSIVIAEQCRS